MFYQWKIIGLNTETGIVGKVVKNSIVNRIDWVKNSEDEYGIKGSYLGHTVLSEPKSNTEFIAFSALSEEVIISWIENTISDSENGIINSALDEQCKRQRITKRQPPWSV